MQRSAVSGKLPVNFLSTTYPDDLNDQRRFVQTIHDAIFTDANAVGILSTHKLSATPRMRVLRGRTVVVLDGGDIAGKVCHTSHQACVVRSS